MRFERRLAKAAGPELELRTLEGAGVISGVLAPRDWTTARVQAWLDWSDQQPEQSAVDPDLPNVLTSPVANPGLLAGGPSRLAQTLAERGWRAGLFSRPSDAGAFRDELFALQAHGVAALGPATGQSLTIARFDDAAALDAFAAAEAAHRLTADALGGLSARLAAVADAVRRCEGDAQSCGDPISNPALARACQAARLAGASDAALQDAIAEGLAGFGGEITRIQGPAAPGLVVHDPDLEAGLTSPATSRLARLAWRSSRFLVAIDEADAQAAAEQLAGPVAALDVMAFEGPEGLDQDALKSAARLLCAALAAAGQPAGCLTLVNVSALLAARGLD